MSIIRVNDSVLGRLKVHEAHVHELESKSV